MNGQKLQEAEKLASRPYQTIIFPDKSTEGELVYVALIPELPGCVSHGETVDEAKASLNEAKIEFIYFMLEDGLAVPEPRLFGTSQRINLSAYLDDVIDRFVERTAPRGVLLTS